MSVRRLPTIPLPYVAALLLAALIGGGIYALRPSGAATPPSAQLSVSAAHPPPTEHRTIDANANDARRPNGEASKSPRQILADAASALRAASGFEVDGAQREGGKTTRMRLLASSQSLDMAASTGTAAYEVLRVPAGLYVRGNSSFWRHYLGARGAILADRWIQGSSSALSSELAPFEPATMARCLTEGNDTLSIAGTTSVNGQPAVVIRDAGNLPGAIPGTLAVATTGPPYPLRVNVAGRHRAGGHIDVCNDGHASGYQTDILTLSNFDRIPPLQPPADAIQSPGPPSS